MEKEFAKYSNLTLTFKESKVIVKVDRQKISEVFNVLDTIMGLSDFDGNINMNCSYEIFEPFLMYIYPKGPTTGYPLFTKEHLQVANQYGFCKEDFKNMFSKCIPEMYLTPDELYDMINIANFLEVYPPNLMVNIVHESIFGNEDIADSFDSGSHLFSKVSSNIRRILSIEFFEVYLGYNAELTEIGLIHRGGFVPVTEEVRCNFMRFKKSIGDPDNKKILIEARGYAEILGILKDRPFQVLKEQLFLEK